MRPTLILAATTVTTGLIAHFATFSHLVGALSRF